MNRRDFGLSLLAAAGTGYACPAQAAASVFVDQIHLQKAKRRLLLLGKGKVLRNYIVGLGFSPEGHKQFLGDGKTPEGRYRIDRRNSASAYHLSLGINYPNARDTAYARSRGKSPGGDIFIHGQPNGAKAARKGDWTRGCIALTNAEMEEIWKYIPTGCPITISP